MHSGRQMTFRAVRRGRGRHGARPVSRHAVSNLGAQAGALASVSLASLLVARAGGPTVVGEYALLRVLPWLFGVVLSAGLPTASAFFMAGDHRTDRRLRPTLSLLAVTGAGLGAAAWLACVIPFHALFFKQVPLPLVTVMAVVVVTQLWTVTAKGCCQGKGDIAGANLIIVMEELWFIPCYLGVLALTGGGGAGPVVASLIAAGTLATVTGLLRLRRGGFFRDWGTPSWRLARRITGFGARGQLGNMLWLMNLRFDFVLLGALAGPAVLGIYAVASKMAELMRLAPTAINYVFYPRFAGLDRAAATAEMRRLLPRAAGLTLVLTPVLAGGAFALPLVYGHAFRAAITPAELIVAGLSVEGAAAIASAFLLGRGRPGLNSAGMAAGAAITVTLDVILIPRYGVLGGAVTSAIAYLVTTTVLILLATRLARTGGTGTAGGAAPAPAADHVRAATARPAAAVPDSSLRRAVDVLVAAVLLVVSLPLLVLIAAAVKVTSRGPVLYPQVRAGRSGQPFTMFKFRSMVSGADRAGPLVTSRTDARVTRVGRLLRVAKLDELPQLVNVLRGEMTLIGPRPEVPRFLPFYREDELAVLTVRPGLTCSGQLFYTLVQEAAPGGGEDAEERYVTLELHPKLALDLEYLRRRSLRADLEILGRTAALLLGSGRRLAAASPQPAAQAAGGTQRPGTGAQLPGQVLGG